MDLPRGRNYDKEIITVTALPAPFLLDVRTQAEFDEGHIEGAILIPDNEIATRAEAELTDKGATILLYCRSGRRSKLAAQALADLGYAGIYEFSGIIDWSYETVK